MEQKHYVGSCQHNIPADWYEKDESTYNVLDEITGAYVLVTTCEECKKANEEAGTIIPEDQIVIDDFNVDFSGVDSPSVSHITVFNADGTSEVLEIEDPQEMTPDEIDEALEGLTRDE
jgi:hypothetical protein